MYYSAKPDLTKAAKLGSLGEVKLAYGPMELSFVDLGATEEPLVNLTLRGIKWYTERPEWTQREVVRAQWKGLEAYKIILAAPDHPAKASLEITVLPSRGYAAVHVRGTWDQKGQLNVRTVESDLAQVAGIWLPKTCVYTEHLDGKLVEGYTQNIQYISLNKPIDAKAFALDGMDLIPGTYVVTGGQVMTWDGKQLGPSPNLKYLPVDGAQSEQRRSGSQRMLPYAAAGACALKGLYFVRRLVGAFKSDKPRPKSAAVLETGR